MEMTLVHKSRINGAIKCRIGPGLFCFTDGMNQKILDDSSANTDEKKFEKNIVVA